MTDTSKWVLLFLSLAAGIGGWLLCGPKIGTGVCLLIMSYSWWITSTRGGTI